MKKIITFLLIIATLLVLLPSCSTAAPYTEGSGELNIVASSFIPFDFARAVTGEAATYTVLQTQGGDIHDYTPTTASLKALSNADIFICIGGQSDDTWIDAALKASNNTDATVIRLTELIDGELAELQGHNHGDFCEQNHSHEHTEHDHEHEHSADDGHNHVSDEHIWTSPKNAITAVAKLSGILAEKDVKNAEIYRANTKAYLEKLTDLHNKYTEAFALSEHKTLVFADRFPFIYLTNDYGACYFAAYNGCSGEINASFDTVVRLSEAISDSSLKYVIVTEDSDQSLAKSIAQSTDCKILTLNSMQSVSLKQIKNKITYLDVMNDNLITLKTALN